MQARRVKPGKDEPARMNRGQGCTHPLWPAGNDSLGANRRPRKRATTRTTPTAATTATTASPPESTASGMSANGTAASSSAVGRAMDESVRPLLDVIDKLRGVGIDNDIDIPQIAVMGDQSSGKSSVLESLSGIPFPRGTGLVTKCATELRMHRSKQEEPWAAKISLTWPDPQPDEAGDVSTPEDLGAKIEALTKALLLRKGGGASFESEHSILIELTAPTVPDLTVIDLPGIVRTAVAGQSNSVIMDVDNLIQKYLKQERTIILAVIPCTSDIATVDILERAQKVDPSGVRTLGVLTKTDLIPEGSEDEVVSILRGILKPLKLGYTALKNRSQKQINEGVSLSDAKAEEMSWFAGQDHFKALDQELLGVDHLSRRLTSVLVDRIKHYIPAMNKEIIEQLRATGDALDASGDLPPSTAEEAREVLMGLVQQIMDDIKNATNGNYVGSIFTDNAQLRLMSQIRSGPHKDFQEAINQLRPQWTVEDIEQAIRDMRGRELPGFPQPAVLHVYVRRFTKDWEEPAQQMLNQIRKQIISVGTAIIDARVPQFHVLASELKQTLVTLVEQHATDACDLVTKMLHDEQQPFTQNHYFMDTYNKIRMEAFEEAIQQAFAKADKCDDEERVIGVDALRKWYADAHSVGNKSNEKQEAENMKALLESYWKTASKRFIDNVPMQLDRALVRKTPQIVETEFYKMAHRNPEKVVESFAIDQQKRLQREQLQAKKDRLLSARKVLVKACGGFIEPVVQ